MICFTIKSQLHKVPFKAVNHPRIMTRRTKSNNNDEKNGTFVTEPENYTLSILKTKNNSTFDLKRTKKHWQAFCSSTSHCDI